MELLLPGRPVSVETIEDALWPIDAEHDLVDAWRTVRIHICQLRRAQPFRIQSIYPYRYILESPMSDPKKSRPKVENAIKAVRGALKESSISEGMTHGKIDISDTTGIGKTSHSNDDVQIDIVVTPKETDE